MGQDNKQARGSLQRNIKMISIIITAYKEPNTISKAIESIIKQIKKEDELIVVCPDKETKEVALKYKKIKHIQDPGKGKPTALNLAFKKAKGEILILTDGDVFISENAVKEIIRPFEDKKVGAVSGRPISNNPKSNMLGFWSHLLTDIGAHETRILLRKKAKFIVCSGYLMAIKNKIIEKIPENSLSDDAVISNLIYAKGYKINYAPEAKVFVNYPTTFKDWIKQKKRSAGGYVQLRSLIQKKDEMRSFSKESLGIFRALRYPRTLKEFYFLFLLVLARLYLWFIILIDIKLKNKEFSKVWERIETTK